MIVNWGNSPQGGRKLVTLWIEMNYYCLEIDDNERKMPNKGQMELE